MTAKEFLSRAYLLDQQIKSKLEQVESLRELSKKCTSAIDGERVSASAEPKKIEGIIAKIIDMENEINSDISNLVDIKHEIANTISTVENPIQKLLLEHRYILCKPWEEVADEIGCSIRTTFEQHGKILKKLVFFENPQLKTLNRSTKV